MSESKAYFPLFPSMNNITSELTNEDLGIVIRAIWDNLPTDKRPEGYTVLQFTVYKMMIDCAERVWGSARKKAPSYYQGGRQSMPRDKYQSDDIDPEEALRLALERSFGSDEDE